MKNDRSISILDVKNHIEKVFPQSEKIDVDLKRLKKGLYKTKISIKIPHCKSLLAIKKEESKEKSLQKAHQAIIRQIHRLKTKWSQKHEPLKKEVA